MTTPSHKEEKLKEMLKEQGYESLIPLLDNTDKVVPISPDSREKEELEKLNVRIPGLWLSQRQIILQLITQARKEAYSEGYKQGRFDEMADKEMGIEL